MTDSLISVDPAVMLGKPVIRGTRITGAMVNAHFRNSLPNRLTIAKAAILRAIDPRLNARSRAAILQSLEPEFKGLCGPRPGFALVWIE